MAKTWKREALPRAAADGAQRRARVLVVADDVIARRALERDPVTDLANRKGLQRKLSRIAAEARAAGRELGVIALGLGGIERVANALGQAAADAMLREAAQRLVAALPDCAIAHISGACFVALAPSASELSELAACAQRALAALDAPIRVAGHELLLAASAGTARFPSDGEEPADALLCAERALALAQRGGARMQAHDAVRSAAALRHFALASRLRGAITRGELELHYQAKVSLRSREVTGFEGLVRWHEPELGTLSPSEFVPIAEEVGLIGALSDWVLREACRQIAAWRAAGLGDVPVAVNLSPLELRRPGVAARVAAILRETGVPAALLGLELTESVLLEDKGRAIRELEALRALGVELALDDFGTGFSSLSLLRKLPVQIVKIDREFISEISTREDAAALTAGVIALAKSLWLRVVAEGVEKETERDLVAIWGCDEVQGFLYCLPVPADAAARLWRERPARSRARFAAG